MPNILITGNGFDLSLGLPTKYEDFMNVMMFIEQNQKYRISFNKIYKLTSQRDKIKLSKTKYIASKNINEISAKLKENLWYQFFKKEPKLDINTWIDFEQKIKYVLGHSLDISDKNYFQNIIDFVKNGKMATLYIIYQNDNSKTKLIKNLFAIFGRECISDLRNTNKLKFLLKDSKQYIEEFTKDSYIDLTPTVYNF